VKISLTTKRELGVVQGTVSKSDEDPMKVESWDTCESIVIAFLQNYVSKSIYKYVIYLNYS